MSNLMPHLPADLILAQLSRSPGNEVKSGKFDSPESSSALVANGFGLFLDRPGDLPPLPGVPMGRADAVELEAEMRFPWSGGRHPWLDVSISTPTTLIGVESKRYEPFRPAKATGFSEVYDRPVWGPNMGRYTRLMHDLVAGRVVFQSLDAVQLVKHALGLRTRAEKRALGAVLVYLYAEPKHWAGSGKPVDAARIALHRREVAQFAGLVRGDQVAFAPVTWADLVAQWAKTPAIAAHAAALTDRFGPLG
ncbi:PGN_0703 family putative restriction endonuclease [Tabrizicola sp.]|uniref:PGN_0703 family putative restriction endonuclease n=1 Tax=Tabrizicola sp. TaxID=2005166 RepID=UPI003D2B4A83